MEFHYLNVRSFWKCIFTRSACDLLDKFVGYSSKPTFLKASMSKIIKMLIYTLAKFLVIYTRSKPAQPSMSNQSNMQLVVHDCSACSLFFKAEAATSKHIKAHHFVANYTCLPTL